LHKKGLMQQIFPSVEEVIGWAEDPESTLTNLWADSCKDCVMTWITGGKI
jgi:hypothetical protein